MTGATWLLDRYKAGSSPREIADELGVSQGSVTTRLRRLGAMDPYSQACGAGSHRWRGGKVVNRDGYVLTTLVGDDLDYCVPMSSGYVMEHRLVMGRVLGRPLRPEKRAIISMAIRHITIRPTSNFARVSTVRVS